MMYVMLLSGHRKVNYNEQKKECILLLSKTRFYVMYKLYVEWPILTSRFLFLKARIYIWIEINSVLERRQRGLGTPAQKHRH